MLDLCQLYFSSTRYFDMSFWSGSTRGIIPVLASRGVLGMYVGYNDGSMNLKRIEGAPRSLQTIIHGDAAHTEMFAFNWTDVATGTSAISLIHTSGHGGTNVGYDGIVFDTLSTYSGEHV